LAGAGCDNDSTAPNGDEIEIGGLFSLTGNWATLGVASKAAMEIGIEDVNQYLSAGKTGMHFTASIQDTKLDPATALTGVTAMKAAGVEVVIGPQSSAEVAAIRSYVDANGVLVISQSSTAGTLAIQNDNIFRLTPSDTLEAVALVGLMIADDAVWITAQAYLATGGRGQPQALKEALVTAADAFYGASGWTKLNAAGDRKFGDFDFFSLTQTGANFSWTLSAQYNTQTGVLTRI